MRPTLTLLPHFICKAQNNMHEIFMLFLLLPFTFCQFLPAPYQSSQGILLYTPSIHFQLTCFLPPKSSCIRISTALIPLSCQLNHVEFKIPKFFISSSFPKPREFRSIYLSVSLQFYLNNYYIILHPYSLYRFQLIFNSIPTGLCTPEDRLRFQVL